MPSSRGSAVGGQKQSRGLSDGGSYKLVPQGEPVNSGSPLPSGVCDPAGGQCDFPGLGHLVGPSSYVESFLGDAAGNRPGSDVQEAYSAQDFLDSYAMQAITIFLIASNAIVIGFETDMPDLCQWDIIENVFLAAFTFELGMKLTVIGPARFFSCRNNSDISWNLFDMSIVSFGLFNVIIDLVMGEGGKLGKDATLFRMIRLLRILRVLRIIRIVRFLKQLYLLAYGFMEGTMAVFWVTLLASFALYICAVILVRTYGRTKPSEDENWEFFREHFGNIPRTMFNLFELLAAPDLVPYRNIMFQYPPLVVFLVTFIVLGSFGINGLLVALINESILEKNQARLEADRMEREAKRKLMQQRCREVFDSIDINGNRVLPRNEIMKCKGQIMQLFEESGAVFRSHDLDQMFYIMDFNDTGIIERGEFVQGVVELCDQIRPMSIMELHCQVSKCASKIEACDLKMEGLAKAIETIEAKEEQRLKQADLLVQHISETADKIDLVQMRQMPQRLVQVSAAHEPPRDESSVVLLPCTSSSDAKLQRVLEDEHQRLVEASSSVRRFLQQTANADTLWTRPSAGEVAELSHILFGLQHETTKLLEALLTESKDLPEKQRPLRQSQSDAALAGAALEQEIIPSMAERCSNKIYSASEPQAGRYGGHSKSYGAFEPQAECYNIRGRSDHVSMTTPQ